MDVAVDQTGAEGCAVGVDPEISALRIDVFLFAEGGDSAIDRKQRVGIENRILESSGQHQPDVSNDSLSLGGRSSGGCGHLVSPCAWTRYSAASAGALRMAEASRRAQSSSVACTSPKWR